MTSSTSDIHRNTTDPNRPEKTGVNWHIFGPGILMASAAIGGSHLVSSTQAGAMYGWQLAIMICRQSFKYPFFGLWIMYDTGDSLIAGYAKKSRLIYGCISSYHLLPR